MLLGFALGTLLPQLLELLWIVEETGDTRFALPDRIVRFTHAAPGELVLAVDPDFSEAISNHLEDATTWSVTPHNVYVEVDTLSARLVISTAELYQRFRFGAFCFAGYLNIYLNGLRQ